MVSPKQPCVRTYDSSDDEFALPSSSRKKRLDPTTTVSNATSLDLQTPSGARDAVDGGSSLPGAEASSAGDGTGLWTAACSHEPQLGNSSEKAPFEILQQSAVTTSVKSTQVYPQYSSGFLQS